MPGRSYVSIGEVLSLLREEFPDVTISKIRFLESQGLLDPERTPSGYRKFYESDVERLRWILRQQREHYLPLKVIKGKLSSARQSAEADGPAPASIAVDESTSGATEAQPSQPGQAGQSAHSSRAARVDTPTPRAPAPAALLLSDPASPPPPPSDRVSLTIEELAADTGLSADDLGELKRFGIIAGRSMGGTVYYDGDAIEAAVLAAGFMRFGVEARHLRMYKSASDREAGFFEQVVMPMLKRRNPRARAQAMEALAELGTLGAGLRSVLLRQALKDYTGQ